MLARGWLAYPVTPVACATTADVRLETPRTIATPNIVAERRHSSVTRYAERNGCVPEVRHYLWPDGFPRMVTMPLTQLFSLKYFP